MRGVYECVFERSVWEECMRVYERECMGEVHECVYERSVWEECIGGVYE
jgi:hypothetical protein